MAPDWLVARPIAHRGLHDERDGIVENTIEAALAAVARGLPIECDVQSSADGAAIVFHDSDLDRLTRASGAVRDRTARELGGIAFKIGQSWIPTFRQLQEAVAGRVPIICEIKSDFDGDMRLAETIARLADDYVGRLAIKSFDPAIIAHLRRAPASVALRPLGIVAQADYSGEDWRALSARQKLECAHFLHYPETRPDFLSFWVEDLPHPTPFLLRAFKAIPVMAWTVRSPAQKDKALQWADQIVFEGDVAF